MLTRLHVRNFKRFEDVVIDLGQTVVLIGPNNSGKTTALQALALWEIGLRRWNEKRRGRKTSPEKRPGVTINRRDLISVPVPDANLLWHDLHVRNVDQANGKARQTTNVRVEIIVEGVTGDSAWKCGLEFDYANPESFYCRPLRTSDSQSPSRMPVPEQADSVRIAFLPPMSGLTAVEPKADLGRLNVLIGEGQTAQVLRNLCYRILEEPEAWEKLVEDVRRLFGVQVLPPEYVAERGEITMRYRERSGIELDVSASGRGLQQTLLLLAHLYANPHCILLLDEPDAHLEILRQRQTFQLLSDLAAKQQSQVIAASHSEVVLNEAAGRGKVIAFVGKPHTMNNKGSQVLKALSDIGWDQYYQAEQAGWVIYLEDATDLAILQAFARVLDHPVGQYLEAPFVSYVSSDQPQKARDHFFGLREAKSDLAGIAIFDRLEKELHTDSPLIELMWSKREIENYFCSEKVLLDFARHKQASDLFGLAERDRREKVMASAIEEVATALATLGKPSPWSDNIKATDDFLDPLFKTYFKKLGLPLEFRKSDYFRLADFVTPHELDPDVKSKLDWILQVAMRSRPEPTPK